MDHVSRGPKAPGGSVAALARPGPTPQAGADARKPLTVSTESLASPPQPAGPPQPVGAPEPCRGCGAPLADDQRYCLECGERRAPMSSVLLGGPPSSGASAPAPPSAPPPPTSPSSEGGAGRGNAVTVIAGVGVLLLAMGVGVLIGRSGGGKGAAAAPQVISVSTAPASGAGTAAGETAAFSDDWPSGTSGYTIQLQTLPVAGTQVSAVEAAKTAASGKGAKEVGALKSEDFSSLPSGEYVIYSGVYKKQAEAQKALAGVKKSFAGAKVVKVSNGGAAGSSSGAGSSSSTSGVGSSPSNPAPPSVLNKLKSPAGSKGPGSGKNYEEQSKKLPNVVSTG